MCFLLLIVGTLQIVFFLRRSVGLVLQLIDVLFRIQQGVIHPLCRLLHKIVRVGCHEIIDAAFQLAEGTVREASLLDEITGHIEDGSDRACSHLIGLGKRNRFSHRREDLERRRDDRHLFGLTRQVIRVVAQSSFYLLQRLEELFLYLDIKLPQCLDGRDDIRPSGDQRFLCGVCVLCQKPQKILHGCLTILLGLPGLLQVVGGVNLPYGGPQEALIDFHRTFQRQHGHPAWRIAKVVDILNRLLHQARHFIFQLQKGIVFVCYWKRLQHFQVRAEEFASQIGIAAGERIFGKLHGGFQVDGRQPGTYPRLLDRRAATGSACWLPRFRTSRAIRACCCLMFFNGRHKLDLAVYFFVLKKKPVGRVRSSSPPAFG
ncbi:hypothetical protein D3C76_707900 [compost metagenome]